MLMLLVANGMCTCVGVRLNGAFGSSANDQYIHERWQLSDPTHLCLSMN